MFLTTSAFGHSWYDKECCNDTDCHKVVKIEKEGNGDIYIIDNGDRVFVSPLDAPTIRPSKDASFHVCYVDVADNMFYSDDKNNRYHVRCIYTPALY